MEFVHGVCLWDVDFSPSGDRLAVVSGGTGEVWLCDATTGQEVGRLKCLPGMRLQVRFSPKGNNLFVYSDKTLQIYEAPSISEIELAEASARGPQPR